MTEALEPPAASAAAPRARQRRLSTVSLASGVDLDLTVAAAPLFDVIQEIVQHEAAADVPFPAVYCPPSLLGFEEPTADEPDDADAAAATVRQRPEDPAALREEGRKLRGEVTYWKHQAEKKVRGGGGGGGGGDSNLLGEPEGDCGGLQLSMLQSGPPGDNVADDVKRLRCEAARWRRRAESVAGHQASAASAVAPATTATTGRRRASTTLERHEVAAAAAAAAASLQRPTNEGATAGGGGGGGVPSPRRESLRELLAWRPPSPIRWDRDRLGGGSKYAGTLGEPRARSGSGGSSGSVGGGATLGRVGRSGGGVAGAGLSVS